MTASTEKGSGDLMLAFHWVNGLLNPTDRLAARMDKFFDDCMPPAEAPALQQAAVGYLFGKGIEAERRINRDTGNSYAEKAAADILATYERNRPKVERSWDTPYSLIIALNSWVQRAPQIPPALQGNKYSWQDPLDTYRAICEQHENLCKFAQDKASSWQDLVATAESIEVVEPSPDLDSLTQMVAAACKTFTWEEDSKAGRSCCQRFGDTLNKILAKNPEVKGAATVPMVWAVRDTMNFAFKRLLPNGIFKHDDIRKVITELQQVSYADKGIAFGEMAELHKRDLALLAKMRAKQTTQRHTAPASHTHGVRNPTPRAADAAKPTPDVPVPLASLLSPAYFKTMKPETAKGRQCQGQTFQATTEGKQAYRTAVNEFVAKYLVPATTPINAKFPLTPGTVSIDDFGCFTCRQPGHHARKCGPPYTPVPVAERNFRCLWVQARSHAAKNMSVNLVSKNQAELDNFCSLLLTKGEDSDFAED
ncbi:hypothetical protein ACM66B_006432 [Microbotryomycetes sp. NB124-2]